MIVFKILVFNVLIFVIDFNFVVFFIFFFKLVLKVCGYWVKIVLIKVLNIKYFIRVVKVVCFGVFLVRDNGKLIIKIIFICVNII